MRYHDHLQLRGLDPDLQKVINTRSRKFRKGEVSFLVVCEGFCLFLVFVLKNNKKPKTWEDYKNCSCNV